MTANLSPEYRDAEERFRKATSPAERLEALEQMLRTIPKHKGTEKLQADIKSRIAKLRTEPQKKAGARGPSHAVPREGAGQVALAGPPNSGKSSLVGALTAAHPKIAEHPFSTIDALPGMMPFEDIAIQLVDLPPLSDVHVEPWVHELVRTADLAWVVVDPGSATDGLELVTRMLAERKTEIVPAGREASGDPAPGWVRRPALLVVTHADAPGADEELAIVRELLDPAWTPFFVSSRDGRGLEPLKRATFEALGVIRVYTRHPGKASRNDTPFTLPAGATVGDLARRIHHDLLAGLRFARIWGPSAFDGQQVHADHVLAEGDEVELHV